ncbi:MAG: hypothetical protein AMXMBFR53_00900 [Gemmatimonadota bacterium]
MEDEWGSALPPAGRSAKPPPSWERDMSDIMKVVLRPTWYFQSEVDWADARPAGERAARVAATRYILREGLMFDGSV